MGYIMTYSISLYVNLVFYIYLFIIVVQQRDIKQKFVYCATDHFYKLTVWPNSQNLHRLSGIVTFNRVARNILSNRLELHWS